MELIQNLNNDCMSCCSDICKDIELLFTNNAPIDASVFLPLFDENNGCSKTTIANLLSSLFAVTDDQDCTNKKLIGSIDIAGQLTEFFESVTSFGTPTVDDSDPDNVLVTLPYTNEDCTVQNVQFTIPIPSPVSTFDSIDLRFDGNGDLLVEAVYTDDDGNTSTITDATPVTLPADYVEYTGNNTVPTGTPDSGVDTRVLANGDRYDWDGSAWVLVPPPSNEDYVEYTGNNTVPTGTPPDGVDTRVLADGSRYDWDGTSWILAHTPCPVEMTRGALLALRNAGNLDPQCHYIITNPPVSGTLTAEKILLHAVDANTLSGCYISTSHDNTAWNGTYDIDANQVLEVFDHQNKNHVIGNDAVTTFPYGNANVYDNIVSHSVLSVTGGTVNGNNISNSSNVTVSGGIFRENIVDSDSTVTIIGGNNIENEFSISASYTQVGTGTINTSKVSSNSSVITGNVSISNSTFDTTTTVNTTGSTGSISQSNFNRTLATAMQNIPNLTFIDVTTDGYSNISATGATRLYMLRGSLRDYGRLLISANTTYSSSYTNIEGSSYVDVNTGTLNLNNSRIGNSSYIRYDRTGASTFSSIQVARGSYIRAYEGTNQVSNSSVTNGSVVSLGATTILQTHITDSSNIDTRGSSGYIYYSTFNRSASSMVGVADLRINSVSAVSYGRIIAVGTTDFLYVTSTALSSNSQIYIYAGGKDLRSNQDNIGSNSAIRIRTAGRITSTGNELNSASYIDQSSTGAFTLSYNSLNSYNGRILLLNSASGNISYNTIGNSSYIRARGTSTNVTFQYNEVHSASFIDALNSVSARAFYNSLAANSTISLNNNPSRVDMQRCTGYSRGLFTIRNSTGLANMYCVSADNQSIMELRNSNSRLSYSSFSTYYYAYFTLTVARTALWGKGRRTSTLTNPAGTTANAVATAWHNL